MSVRPTDIAGITERSLNTLELPAVRALLAERSSFIPGRELAQHISPVLTLREAERLQDETEAARALIRAQPSAGIGGARDIRDALRRARLGGALDPEQLIAIADTVRAAAKLFTDIHPYPPLAALAQYARPPRAPARRIAPRGATRRAGAAPAAPRRIAQVRGPRARVTGADRHAARRPLRRPRPNRDAQRREGHHPRPIRVGCDRLHRAARDPRGEQRAPRGRARRARRGPAHPRRTLAARREGRR